MKEPYKKGVANHLASSLAQLPRGTPGQRFGFHNLRHSLATFLINKERDTKTVQGLLRHANVSTTLGLYGVWAKGRSIRGPLPHSEQHKSGGD